MVKKDFYIQLIQSAAHRLGYHIRRLDTGVSIEDPYVEQKRLLGHKAKVIFEIGAADGRDCLRYAELFCDAKIYAFEPFPGNFDLLKNKSAHKEPRIIPVNAAVSKREGKAKFYVSEWSDASSLFRATQTGSTFDKYTKTVREIHVNTVTLDSVCSQQGVGRIDILKMDAQGAELDILKGAENILGENNIELIYSEIHFKENYEGGAMFCDLMGYLGKSGFKLHNIYNIVHNQKGQLAWGDAIFIHHGE